jgi:hypothetical protein
MPFDSKPTRSPKYDFKNPANRHGAGTFDHVLEKVALLTAQKWGDSQMARSMNMDAGQIASLSKCATTAMIEGFFQRQSQEVPWANGEIVKITDAGVGIGVKEIEWGETSVRNPSANFGLTALDMSPERAIEVAKKLHTAKKGKLAHKVILGFHEMAEDAQAGYNTMREKGNVLRDQHMLDFNEAILRGIPAAGKLGITNYPGIKRMVSTINWATANADVINDEWNQARSLMYTDAGLRERAIKPTKTMLPLSVDDHFTNELFNPGGTDTTLKTFIENNNRGHEFIMDNSLRSADTFGHPGAILLADEADAIDVITPVFCQIQPAVEVAGNQWAVEIEIWTLYYGVRMKDPRAVCFVDGGSVWTV